MEEKTRQLGEEKISRLLMKFSIPAIIGMLANSLYTIIDRVFVGNIVGPEAIAGMSITLPISFVIMAFGMLVGIGSGALISIRLGQQRREEAEKLLGNAFSLVLIISVVVTAVLLWNLDTLLIHFGASPRILPYGRQFISIILWGSLFQYIGFGLGTIIRSEGNPRIAMMTMLINAGLNTVLDVIFIYLMGFGIRGAAFATVISQGVSAAWVVLHFSSRRGVLRLRLKNMPLRWSLVKGIFAIGMSPFLMQMAASVVNLLFNQGLARYGGDSAIAAFGIINTIVMFIMMPIFGINQGSQPIIGFNYGARQYGRVKTTLKQAIIAATIIICAGYLVFELFPALLMRAFTSDREVIELGAHGMRIVVLMFPVDGFQIVSANFFQAIGKARKSIILSLLRQVIVLIPMLLILPRIFHLEGVWMASPVADAVSSLVTVFVLMAEVRQLRAKSRENLPMLTTCEGKR